MGNGPIATVTRPLLAHVDAESSLTSAEFDAAWHKLKRQYLTYKEALAVLQALSNVVVGSFYVFGRTSCFQVAELVSNLTGRRLGI
jgi:hypothetical protein